MGNLNADMLVFGKELLKMSGLLLGIIGTILIAVGEVIKEEEKNDK